MSRSLTIVRGTNDKPVASEQLATALTAAPEIDGQLLIGYPIIGSPDGRRNIDAVYISLNHGVVIFDLVEGTDVEGYEDRQDEVATKLEARLLTHRELVKRRKLTVAGTDVDDAGLK
ncbi:hypothetical protein [Rhodococcus erythropolis]